MSGLRVGRIVGPFIRGHVRTSCKRLLYEYFVREVDVATLELLAGAALTALTALTALGSLFGSWAGFMSVREYYLASSGTVMLAGLCVVFVAQLLLLSLHSDIEKLPHQSPHRKL